MRNWIRYILLSSLLLSCSVATHAQSGFFQDFWVASDTLNKKRFNLATISCSTLYTGFSIGLYNTWYRQYPQTSFHLFDDRNEWGNVDKAGHLHTAYWQGVIGFKGAKWTGLEDNDAILVGALCGGLFQTTIEVMDGFSEKWGFSIADMAANAAGVSLFVAQQKYWGEQKINIKVSSWPNQYSSAPILSTDGLAMSSLDMRTNDLFGSNYVESFLKDYNAQTIWASFNINSLLSRDTKLPDWFNIAVGYGSENNFGGFENRWTEDQNEFFADEILYPRHQQYYLGLDVDLTRIKVKSPFLKTVLSVLNIFKFPLPALEYNSLGKFKFHALSK